MYIRLVLLAGLVSAAIRPLEWGHVNFLHTTDTHGWLAGHLLEPDFSADWGDYISFITHMKEKADAMGVDLIVVDGGDRHDGNGLSDATPVDGEYSLQIFERAPLDVVSIGNHELYVCEVAEQEYREAGVFFNEKYLVSNVDILDSVTNEWTPMGNKLLRMTTPHQGINIMAMGFLFNFHGNCKNTRVTNVELEVQKDWFQEAIRDPYVDLFLLVGHIPVRYFQEFRTIIDEIRKVRPTVPIQALGGHTHIRDYVIYDDYATGLESGRFMETIGWASVNRSVNGLKFARSYLDNNRRSFAYHSFGVEESSKFDTQEGTDTSMAIDKFRQQLNLTDKIGCVPQNYLLGRAKYPGNDSLLTLLEDHALQKLERPAGRSLHSRNIIINTGSIRFDLYKGPYTKDSGYIVSPFKNKWVYIPDMPKETAALILPILNKRDYIIAASGRDYRELGQPMDRAIPSSISHHSQTSNHADQSILQMHNEKSSASPGYITHDDLGNTGDDTIHVGWVHHRLPNAIQSTENNKGGTTDVVFYDFLIPFIADALYKIGAEQYVETIDHYSDLVMGDIMKLYFNNTASMC